MTYNFKSESEIKMSEQEYAFESDQILEAIDFFTQVLHPEQLETYGYEYVHDALKFQSSQLWMKNGEMMCWKASRGIAPIYEQFIVTQQVARLATKVGVVLTSGLEVYLPEYLMTTYQPNFMMPLIVADELIGLIISNSWHTQNLLYAETLKKLINNAFYTGIQIEKNTKFRQLMDRKLYNQMLMHRLMALTLTELDLEQLIKSCVEGIRELTASVKTGFCLYDERMDKMTLRHFEDLRTFKQTYFEVAYNQEVVSNRLTFSVKDDKELLADMFGSIEPFERIGALYVTLLKKTEVIGFVTMGETITGNPFDVTLFETIESILTAICSAIDNANHLQMLEKQKKQIDQAKSALEHLTQSIKTVTSATDLEELSQLVLQSLEIFAGIDEAYIAYRDEDGMYTIAEGSTEHLRGQRFSLNEQAVNMLSRGVLIDHGMGSLSAYLDSEIPEADQLKTCIAPIDVVHFEEVQKGPCAVILAMSFKTQFLHFELNYLEAMASSIAPIIRQMRTVEALNEERCKTGTELFLEKLEEYENQRQKFWMDYKVYYKPWTGKIFHERETSLVEANAFVIGNKICTLAFLEEIFDASSYEADISGTPEEIIEALEVLCS